MTSPDLQRPWIIHAKGALFVILGLISGGFLIAQMPTLRTIVLLAVSIWAFCRFYYYLFYVLERYLGREKRFAGVFDAMRYVISEAGRDRDKG